jgi:hypothetical protein
MTRTQSASPKGYGSGYPQAWGGFYMGQFQGQNLPKPYFFCILYIIMTKEEAEA